MRQPEEYFPSYLNYLFSRSTEWLKFKQGQGTREPNPERIALDYKSKCNTGATITVDKNIVDARERIDYIKHARVVADQNVLRGEELIEQIVCIGGFILSQNPDLKPPLLSAC